MKNMEIIDANIVLRYLLSDDEVLSKQAIQIIDSRLIKIPTEIVAEIVYVLEKVYNVPRKIIKDVLSRLFSNPNIYFDNQEVILSSLIYYEEYSLDYADSLLLAYNKASKFNVLTFDKKLKKLLSSYK